MSKKKTDDGIDVKITGSKKYRSMHTKMLSKKSGTEKEEEGSDQDEDMFGLDEDVYQSTVKSDVDPKEQAIIQEVDRIWQVYDIDDNGTLDFDEMKEYI